MDRSCLDATHDLWGIPHLFVDMCTDPNDPTLRTIDLTQFFGNNDNGTRSHHIEFDEKLYFPSFVTPAATKLSDVNSMAKCKGWQVAEPIVVVSGLIERKLAMTTKTNDPFALIFDKNF